jgi:hypothetical protein
MHALVLVGIAAVASFVPLFRIWPLLWLVPLAGYAALVAFTPQLRATFRPWRFGRVSGCAMIATFVIALGSCAELVAFSFLAAPDPNTIPGFLHVSTLRDLLAVCVLFSIFNAIFEEVVFRGILFDAFESQWGIWVAAVATALLFGYGHMHGYPPGPLGAVLAGIYGLCLAWLRVFSGGIGLPIIAHVAADATIFIIFARVGVL